METTGRKFGYARVSSREQNLARQLDALTAAGVDERDIFCDKMSGKNFDRPNYTTLRDYVLRPGDELFVESLDRLGRNKNQIVEELNRFETAGIRVRILDLPTTLVELDGKNDWVMEMVTKILIEVYASIAQQERETIRKRQREGIDAAKLRGKHLGRKRAEIPENFAQVVDSWRRGDITAADAIRQTGVGKTRFYQLVKQME